MEDFKNELKEVIKRKIIEDSYDGYNCLGCVDNTRAHTCDTTMVEKIESEFNRAFFFYMRRNNDQVRGKLSRAILIELLADELPRERAVVKADEIGYHDYVRFGGGTDTVTSTSKEEEEEEEENQ